MHEKLTDFAVARRCIDENHRHLIVFNYQKQGGVMMSQFISAPKLLELQNANAFVFDLTRPPPGRIAEPAPLTEEQIQDAIGYNTRRYNSRNIRRIQDIIGAPVTGTVDKTTINYVVQWQADFKLTTDGKVGKNTLKPIVLELIRTGNRLSAVWLIIDGHNISIRGLKSLKVVPVIVGHPTWNAATWPTGDVQIAHLAFRQGYRGLVHTIAHELEHVRLFRIGTLDTNVHEFLGESIEILSERMLREPFWRFMDDAQRAINYWAGRPASPGIPAIPPMSAVLRKLHWDLFVRVRNRVRRRFKNTTATIEADHIVTHGRYNAQVKPP